MNAEPAVATCAQDNKHFLLRKFVFPCNGSFEQSGGMAFPLPKVLSGACTGKVVAPGVSAFVNNTLGLLARCFVPLSTALLSQSRTLAMHRTPLLFVMAVCLCHQSALAPLEVVREP